MSNTQETLREMARLTMLTNKLNDVQIKNLKMYPFVFFEGVRELNLEYDLSNNLDVSTEENKKDLDVKYDVSTETKHQFITYRITVDDRAFGLNQEHIQNRYNSIVAATRNIFWKDLKVNVYLNNMLLTEK